MAESKSYSLEKKLGRIKRGGQGYTLGSEEGRWFFFFFLRRYQTIINTFTTDDVVLKVSRMKVESRRRGLFKSVEGFRVNGGILPRRKKKSGNIFSYARFFSPQTFSKSSNFLQRMEKINKNHFLRCLFDIYRYFSFAKGLKKIHLLTRRANRA